jgi:hypothetical protein
MNVIFGRFKLQGIGIMVAVLLLFTASAAGCGKIAIQTTTGTTSTIPSTTTAIFTTLSTTSQTTSLGGPIGYDPYAITNGPDGNIWFTEPNHNGDKIGKISPINGAVTEYNLTAPQSAGMGLRRVPMATCGSPNPMKTKSVKFPQPARLQNTLCPLITLLLLELHPVRTVTCGLRKTMGTKSAKSRQPTE